MSCDTVSFIRAAARGCLGALLVAGAVASCGDDEEARPKAAQPKPKAAKAASSAAPPSTLKPQFSYVPVGKRDPFYSYLAELRQVGEQHRTRKLEATEKYELDQYRLTALLTGTAQPKAMVEDPDGKGHTLRIGSRLGKNGGVVTRITSTGIVVTEEFRAPTGERMRVPITIKLPQPELEISTDR